MGSASAQAEELSQELSVDGRNRIRLTRHAPGNSPALMGRGTLDSPGNALSAHLGQLGEWTREALWAFQLASRGEDGGVSKGEDA